MISTFSSLGTHNRNVVCIAIDNGATHGSIALCSFTVQKSPNYELPLVDCAWCVNYIVMVLVQEKSKKHTCNLLQENAMCLFGHSEYFDFHQCSLPSK